tara:strand:+ start:13120 stop:14154 length:1035 start_codon:yes stop_codon:yes gene_type:complete
MAYTTINKSKLYMNSVVYSGNAGTQGITGVGFQPDFTWIKNRAGSAENHAWTDVVRGVTKTLASNSNGSESTVADGLTAFGADGFTLGASDQFNGSSGRTYVGWNWKAGGTGSSNSDGTITSTVSVNTTAGFSVGTYTANATAGATVGHGLGVAPAMLIVKTRNNSNNWAVYHQNMGATKAMYLDQTSAETTDGWMNNVAPSASVFTLSGGNYGNASGYTPVFYAFAEKPGYSKFSAYKGNGNANGAFVYTGFRPSFILIKNKTDSGEAWEMFDDKRIGYNEKNYRIYANANDIQDTNIRLDMLSNGFKIRTTGSHVNENGDTMIYAAFGQSLVGTNNIAANAR